MRVLIRGSIGTANRDNANTQMPSNADLIAPSSETSCDPADRWWIPVTSLEAADCKETEHQKGQSLDDLVQQEQ